MSNSIKVTDKKGKFVGGAAARRKVGHKIQNPMVREKLKSAIGRHVHPQERMFASILRSLPRDILKSHNFPFYRDQLRTDMCQRVSLPMLAPLKAKYNDMTEFNQMHASTVLEEARHIIAEGLFQRWGKDRIPPENGLELEFSSNEKMSGNSEHLVYYFLAKKDLTIEMKSKLRAGTVVELMPLDHHSAEGIVLGNIVRRSPKGFVDAYDAEAGRQIAVMIYNKSGENFQGGARLVALDSLLNLTRQFDVLTNGNNHLNYEILGTRRKQRIHIKFADSTDESSSHDESDSSDSDSDSSGDSSDNEVIESEDSDDDQDEVIEIEDSDEDEIVKQEPEEDTAKSEDEDGEHVNVKTEKSVNGERVESEEGADVNEEVETNVNESVEEDCDVDESTSEIGEEENSDTDQAAYIPDKKAKAEKLDEEDKLLAESIYHVPRLNPTQKKAAKAFLDSVHERISIVQG
jgi:hypothetical protein